MTKITELIFFKAVLGDHPTYYYNIEATWKKNSQLEKFVW